MNIDIPAIFTLTPATIYASFSSQILKSTLSEVHAGGKLLLWTFAVVDGGCQSCLFDGPIIWRELVGMVHLTAIPGLHMYHFASTQGYINMLLCSRCALIIIWPNISIEILVHNFLTNWSLSALRRKDVFGRNLVYWRWYLLRLLIENVPVESYRTMPRELNRVVRTSILTLAEVDVHVYRRVLLREDNLLSVPIISVSGSGGASWTIRFWVFLLALQYPGWERGRRSIRKRRIWAQRWGLILVLRCLRKNARRFSRLSRRLDSLYFFNS